MLEEIRNVRETLDLAFMREDALNLLSESLDGMQRVKRVVQDLRDVLRTGPGSMGDAPPGAS